MTQSSALFTLSGTWTLDPLLPVFDFWREYLGLDAEAQVTPYAQVFQQLLDPGSALRRNSRGANFVCLRWEDLLPEPAATSTNAHALLAARIDEFANALSGFDHVVPCMVLVGPSDPTNPSWRAANAALGETLVGLHNVHVLDGNEALRRYGVAHGFDAASERFGHVPYTPEALAALGTVLVRAAMAALRKPVKLFAVDGDHTLWSGVVGEQGVDGLRVDAGHLALQRMLSAQTGSGRLLCLLSKNEEADARAVFERRGDMALRWDDFIEHRVDWNPKPGNLRELASSLELGLDGMVFLDDNPVECAQMRAQSPTTLTVRVPADPARLEAFVQHLWLFDHHATTDEDRKRAGMYRDNAARARSLRDAGSLQSFLDGLELVVQMEPPAASDVPRLAQLSQRTNQFNASLVRLQEGEVLQAGDGAFHRAVRARDRFGDYGLVGQVRGRAVGDRLQIDLFMLSCRALGRGIEHRMIAEAGRHALASGLSRVSILFRAGERNTPARRFLEAQFGALAQGDPAAFTMDAERAVGIVFDAVAAAAVPADDVDTSVIAPAARDATDLGEVYERIAHELTTAAEIERAIAARGQPRPELAVGFVAPAPGMERDVAGIWQQALRIDRVGARDPFRDLGGKSIHLVQVHRLLLERLGIDVDITILFQHPTVASLAAHLAPDGAAARTTDAAQQRGQRMREAQARAAARRHAGGGTQTRTGT
ncbi:HAD-IIIC family phosphatase [Luteimonas aestuarii]|nr:HAD-IIIC family phosphatase [Luteimonas aestuarii]